MIIPRFNYYPSRQYKPTVKRRELADYRAKEVQLLHNEGKTTAEIADLLGITQARVQKLLRK